jgi:hypothetical protein
MKYEVIVDWSGYSRGYTTYVVEADNKQDAKDKVSDGEVSGTRHIVRDDTESLFDDMCVTEIV